MYNALKQSTATQAIKVGPVVNAAGDVQTTLVITDFQAAKNGGALAALHTATIAYDAAGIYTITLDATDTDTLGRLVVACVKAATVAPPSRYQVVTANVYDSLVSGSDLLDANAAQLGGSAQTGRDIGASVLLSPGTGTGQINLTALHAMLAGAIRGTVTTVSSGSSFILDSADLSATDDVYNGLWLVFTTGACRGISRLIGDYNGTSKQVDFSGAGNAGAFPVAPSVGDAWMILAASL